MVTVRQYNIATAHVEDLEFYPTGWAKVAHQRANELAAEDKATDHVYYVHEHQGEVK